MLCSLSHPLAPLTTAACLYGLFGTFMVFQPVPLACPKSCLLPYYLATHCEIKKKAGNWSSSKRSEASRLDFERGGIVSYELVRRLEGQSASPVNPLSECTIRYSRQSDIYISGCSVVAAVAAAAVSFIPVLCRIAMKTMSLWLSYTGTSTKEPRKSRRRRERASVKRRKKDIERSLCCALCVIERS